MKKAELVVALSRYADHRRGGIKGQDTLARFLAYYFDNLDIPADQTWGFWKIEPYIPQLLLGAFELFRTSEDETVRLLRTRYEDEVGRPFADPTDVRDDGFVRAPTVLALGDLFTDAIGAEWLADKIDAVFNAERNLIRQVFYKFLDRVYRRGLFQISDESPPQHGTFGETTLYISMMGGRRVFTFVRPGDEMEHSVSFVSRDGDPLGLGVGVQSVCTDLQTAIGMINDVITGWPEDRSAQADILKTGESTITG